MEDCQIRFVTPVDKKAYTNMRFQLWPQLSVKEHGEDFDKLIEGKSTSKRHGVVAYTRSRKEAGFMDFSIRSYVDGCSKTPVAHLEGIWVTPDLRTTGIGKALVGFFEKWALENGHVEITSDTDIDNVLSQKTHIKWGFEEVDRIVIFRKSLAK